MAGAGSRDHILTSDWLQVNHQLGVNRNTRHQIERDLANKDHSINIDHTCHNLQNTSRAINLHGGIEKVDPNISIPETWADFSNRNIQASQCKYSNSAANEPSAKFSQSRASTFTTLC